MRALVRYGRNPGEFDVQEVADPVPGPDEVVLKVAACGVCGSDLEMYRHPMRSDRGLPMIPGHEFSGEIVAVGSQVTGWKVGDRVTCETAAITCGECVLCRTGHYNLCPQRIAYGFQLDGAFAEYIVTKTHRLHRIPEGVPTWYGALTEPAAVAYNAVGVHSRIEPGDFVVVLGTGCIGLMALQVALLHGAEVLLVGISGDERRLEAGQQLGAHWTAKSDQDPIAEIVRERTDGLGAALVVDAVGGVAETVNLATQLVRPLGQITKIGWFRGEQPLRLDALLRKTARIQGCFSHNWPSWERVLKLMATGRIQVEPMVSHRLPLEAWKIGYEASITREAVKAAIFPNGLP
ncbi:MAG: Zn-dependent alcohol dehydrogenase [Candidatus Poribacteria bacterium]|nr:MAG: Zn-dependent alcohol dehydrogenase [Candidatus Poribacteria bacterium]